MYDRDTTIAFLKAFRRGEVVMLENLVTEDKPFAYEFDLSEFMRRRLRGASIDYKNAKSR